MMRYIFRTIVNLAIIACIGLLGYLVYCGASAWLVVVMFFLCISMVLFTE